VAGPPGAVRRQGPGRVVKGAPLDFFKQDLPRAQCDTRLDDKGRPLCKITIEDRPHRAPREMYRQMDPDLCLNGFAPICRDVSDPNVIADGIAGRMCRPTIAPDPALLREFESFVDEWCDACLHGPVTPLDFETWLAGTSYNEARKNQLRECHVKDLGGPPPKDKCQSVSLFGKVEDYPAPKRCRGIYSRSDRFKAFSGPIFKAVETEVFHACNAEGSPFFVKHTPVPERPTLINGLRAAGMVYAWTDFTSFESSFSSEFMTSCECRVYARLLGERADLAEVIRKTITGKNVCKSRTGVTATIRGRRMSGDMCTSLGNGLSNCLITLFACKKAGYDWRNIKGLFEGDDGITQLPGMPHDHISGECNCPLCRVFSDMGFTIKLTVVEDPAYAGFCGIVSSTTDNLRDPIAFLSSFAWTSSCIQSRKKGVMQSLLRAKALSASYETPNCPIVGAVARAALNKTRGVCPRFVEDGYHNTSAVPRDESKIPPFNPSPATRALFTKLYGIDVDSQVRIENYVLAHGALPKESCLMADYAGWEMNTFLTVGIAGKG